MGGASQTRRLSGSLRPGGWARARATVTVPDPGAGQVWKCLGEITTQWKMCPGVAVRPDQGLGVIREETVRDDVLGYSAKIWRVQALYA